jgi:hypothetical protein
MTKLRKEVRLAVAGAGLFSVSVFLLGARILVFLRLLTNY